jgi:hypothetical protein
MSKNIKVTAVFQRPLTQYDTEDAFYEGYPTVQAWLTAKLDHPDNLYYCFGNNMSLCVETTGETEDE